MKKLFTFLLLILSHYCSAQNFGVRDFLLAQKSEDFELISYFLVKYHHFHYSDELLDGDCKGYKFENASQHLDIMRCLTKSNDNKPYRFVLLYRVSISDFSEFQKSLITANYVTYSVTNTTDGHKVTMWTLKDTRVVIAC